MDDISYARRNPDGNRNVAYLNWNDDRWVLNWNWLDNDNWDANDRLVRFGYCLRSPALTAGVSFISLRSKTVQSIPASPQICRQRRSFRPVKRKN
ncbi:hypothetical protein HY623_00985 [Candidatus Uhrbacteria bacterium]|nr:hypothetical protein [Candidatus Uhrbacteria bacterium]